MQFFREVISALLTHVGVTEIPDDRANLRRGSMAARLLGLGGSNPAGSMEVCHW